MHSIFHQAFIVTMISSFFFTFFLVLMLSSDSPFAQPFESHPIVKFPATWTTDFSADQPILIRETNVTKFGCGFFCVACCDTYAYNCTVYVFGVFISGSNDWKPQVVWSTNLDYPVGINAMMNFTATGELVLRDEYGSIVWSTNTAGRSVVGMNLTDIGNLVLFNDQNLVVWQSFDHPADCLLPEQKLFADQKLKSSVSLTNSMGLEGTFFLQADRNSLFAYVESNPPQAYYRMFGDDNIPRSHLIRSSDPGYVTYIQGVPSPLYIKLMPNGHLQVFEQKYEGWTMVDLTEESVEECGYPLACGKNSICTTDQQCICPGTEYFRPMNDRQPNLGCSQITPLTCNSTQDQDFITLENVEYFTLNADMDGVSMETCKEACLHNCSCKAAFFQYYTYAAYGECYLSSEIFTMKTANPDKRASAFIKVQNVRSHDRVTRVVGSLTGSFVLVVAIGFIVYMVHRHRRNVEMEEDLLDQVPGMPTRFSYDELKTATENFSKKLGEGGFGSVFEGSLKDGSKIAVKCLQGLSHVKKSFLAEVQSIGSIHHVNLVRLRGFCTWKSQRFLVYDFMSNGSLDRWIYHGNQEHILEWKCKKKIILDVAKGLAYLHEDCRLKIIHLDIKPQNILLHEGFNAKVSDFGLSKLMDRNQTQVMTTMRGTPGYMAPEWLSSIITEKVDVYSFGIVLLEILCGRKNFDRSQPEESWHLLRVFQKCWEQGTLLDIVDMSSEDKQRNGIEVMEMMKMASWCLQTDYTKRPLMSSVVKVLEGETTVESNLDYNFTDPRLQKNDNHEKDSTPMPSSILSGPR